MSEDWKTQLQSENPRDRVEAIKAIANSGDRANLPYLKGIVENDPDPRLRDYARKAARHLFTSTEETGIEQVPPQQRREPVQERELRPPEKVAASPPPPRAVPPAERSSAETKIQRALSLHMNGNTQKALKAFTKGLDLDPNIANETFTRSVASELTGLDPDEAIAKLMDSEERKVLLNPPKDPTKESAQASETGVSSETAQPVKPREGLVQTWLSFFSMSESFLAEEADHANTEDTLLSVMVFTIAAVLLFMITGTVQFRQITTILNEQLAQAGENLPLMDFNFGVIFLFMLVGTVIVTPLSFFIGSGIQFLGARLFGGSGDFKSHLYLLAVIQVPITILGGLISIISLIPFIGVVAGLAGFGLSIFTLIITVRVIKAVHNLSTGRAVAGMILPPIILVFLIGCLMTIFGSALISMLADLG